jgi:hypothetical protein
MSKTEEDFDVVIDALSTKYDAMMKMTQSNMEMGMFNIMDQIRLEQCDQLTKAIKMWQESA